MKQYTDLLRRILTEGRYKENRTGKNTYSILGPQMEFNMDDGFPMVTERPIFFKGMVYENLWFLAGECNNEALLANGVKIWNKWALSEAITAEMPKPPVQMIAEWAELKGITVAEAEKRIGEDFRATLAPDAAYSPFDEVKYGLRVMAEDGLELTSRHEIHPKGSLGPIYGVLWRDWQGRNGGIDQISRAIDKLRSDNPKVRYSRANVVTAFDPSVVPDETTTPQQNIENGLQALAACHTFFQLFVEPMTLEERVAWSNKRTEESRRLESEGGQTRDIDWLELDANALWVYSSKPAQDFTEEDGHELLDKLEVARDQLSLKLYQRKQNCALAA